VSQRADRFAHLLQRELAELVRELKDPRVQSATLVTVTHVQVADDLGVARVLVSVVADDRRAVLRAIGRAQRHLHAQLGRRLHTKKVPELRFHLDETEDRAGRIDALLREVSEEPPVGESGSGGDGEEER
jgi:ribosome-binding factor A